MLTMPFFMIRSVPPARHHLDLGGLCCSSAVESASTLEEAMTSNRKESNKVTESANTTINREPCESQWQRGGDLLLVLYFCSLARGFWRVGRGEKPSISAIVYTGKPLFLYMFIAKASIFGAGVTYCSHRKPGPLSHSESAPFWVT